MTIPTISQPNYTQVPNVILDDLLPLLGFAELKVLMFLCRQTFGWHEAWTDGSKRRASIRATVAGTGLSKPAVIAAYASLEARGVAEWRSAAAGDVVEWRIKTAAEGGKEALPVSAGVVKQVDQGSKAALPGAVKQVDHIKETERNGKETESLRATSNGDVGAGGADLAPEVAPPTERHAGSSSPWDTLGRTIAFDLTGSEERAYITRGRRAGALQAWVGHIVGDVGRVAENDPGAALDMWIMFRASVPPDDWERYVSRATARERFGRWTLNGGAASVAAVLAGRGDTRVMPGDGAA